MKHREYHGKTALVRYRGGAVGEEIIEDLSQGDPVKVRLGAGDVPKGVDAILYDMDIGEQRTAIILAKDAYGEHDPEGVQHYPRHFVNTKERLEVGSVIGWQHPVSGVVVPVVVIEATQNTVTIDFNHLLAGKDLEYWFELVDIID